MNEDKDLNPLKQQESQEVRKILAVEVKHFRM